MSVFELDAMRENREADLNQLIKHRDWLAEQIKRCKEDGPEMMSLCKEYTYVKKEILVLRGSKGVIQ